MKKLIKIIIIQFIILCFIVGNVFADSDPCKITLSSNKKTLEPGDEITLNVIMSNITAEEGIKTVIASIEYDDSIFEIVSDESDVAQAVSEAVAESTGYSESDLQVIYIGALDTEIADNSWNAILANDEESQMELIMAISTEIANDTVVVAKINLKVKEDAESGTAQISLPTIYAGKDEQDLKTLSNTANISFKIQADDESSSSSETPPTTTGTDTSKNNVKSNTNSSSKNNNTTAGNKTPYTGLDDYIFAISIVVFIGFISFIKYREYKDIKID